MSSYIVSDENLSALAVFICKHPRKRFEDSGVDKKFLDYAYEYTNKKRKQSNDDMRIIFANVYDPNDTETVYAMLKDINAISFERNTDVSWLDYKLVDIPAQKLTVELMYGLFCEYFYQIAEIDEVDNNDKEMKGVELLKRFFEEHVKDEILNRVLEQFEGWPRVREYLGNC